MKKIRVYRNAHCATCARFAKVAQFFDWLHRVDLSIETPKTGPLRVGEVVVEELASGRILRGAEGMDLIWGNIPVYAPFRLLLRVPSFRRFLEKNVSGCKDNTCEVSSKSGTAVHR
jgi:hypothetical protein